MKDWQFLLMLAILMLFRAEMIKHRSVVTAEDAEQMKAAKNLTVVLLLIFVLGSIVASLMGE